MQTLLLVLSILGFCQTLTLDPGTSAEQIIPFPGGSVSITCERNTFGGYYGYYNGYYICRPLPPDITNTTNIICGASGCAPVVSPNKATCVLGFVEPACAGTGDVCIHLHQQYLDKIARMCDEQQSNSVIPKCGTPEAENGRSTFCSGQNGGVVIGDFIVNHPVAHPYLFQPNAETITVPEETAELIDGKCSICMREHRKSTVTMGSGSTTLLYCGAGHYDEDGRFVPPEPCNTVRYDGHCSNGHHVVSTSKVF